VSASPFKGWIAAGRGIGFFLLLAGGSAALGFAIAWPLWLFATSQRSAYTVFVLCLLAAGLIALVTRRITRRRRDGTDPGRPRRSAISALLGVLQVLIVLSGLWGEAVLVARGLWLFAIVGLIAWAAIVWALGIGRRAANRRKRAAIPAENSGE